MKSMQSVNACTTTRIFCRPDCPPGRRTNPENRIQFTSPITAVASGYRACKVCEPDEWRLGPPGKAWISKAERDEQAKVIGLNRDEENRAAT
jgi:methylphosphotriester-DNA--protein-cysteine methyltransferase